MRTCRLAFVATMSSDQVLTFDCNCHVDDVLLLILSACRGRGSTPLHGQRRASVRRECMQQTERHPSEAALPDLAAEDQLLQVHLVDAPRRQRQPRIRLALLLR